MQRNIKHPWFAVYVAIAVFFYLPLFFFSLGVRHDQLVAGMPERLAYPVYERDQIGFVDIADNIINHKTFSERLSAPYDAGTFRTPGLPALLVVWKLIFGSYTAFPIFQIMLAVLAAFMIFRIGEKLYSAKVGGIAGLIFLIDPNTIFHSLVVQADLLNAFLIVLIIYFFCVSPKRSSKAGAIIFGLLIGFSTLVRPISMFLIVFFIPFYIYFESGIGRKKLALNFLLFIFGFCLLVVPWIVRNKIQTGTAGISSVKDYNFFHYYIPSYLAYKKGISESEAKEILLKEIYPINTEQTDSLAYSSQVHNAWIKYFKEDPFGYAKFHIIKTIPVFLSSGTKMAVEGYGSMMGNSSLKFQRANMSDLLVHMKFKEFFLELLKNPFIVAEELGLAIICFLAILAISFRKNRGYTILLLGLIFYFALLTGTVAYSRFRLPIAPLLFLLSLFALSQLKVFFRKR